MTAGQPVYLPVVVAVVDGDTRDGGTRSATWLAFSPFSRKASHLLRRLIAIRCDRYPPLRQVIENLAGRPTEALLADYDRIGINFASSTASCSTVGSVPACGNTASWSSCSRCWN